MGAFCCARSVESLVDSRGRLAADRLGSSLSRCMGIRVQGLSKRTYRSVNHVLRDTKLEKISAVTLDLEVELVFALCGRFEYWHVSLGYGWLVLLVLFYAYAI